MSAIKTILFPTDFSPRSEAAFQLAHDLARDYGAELIVLNVLLPPVIVAEPYPFPVDHTFEYNNAREALARITSPDSKVTIRHMLREGDPAKEIVQVANDNQVDLVVMGTHGRTGLSRVLMGSVAEQVLRHCSCPVITLRTPAADVGEAPAPADTAKS